MATFLIAHGAWSGGWAWKKMRAPLAERGHVLLTPTYTGLGERSHLANPSIDLETHIADILAVLEFENLEDVVLVAHSYGGMVATGVLDRAGARIGEVIYLDAFVPKEGHSLFDYQSGEACEQMRELARIQGDGWAIPPGPLAPGVAPDDVEWLAARRRPQPLKTFEQKLALGATAPDLPRSYIYCRKKAPGDVFVQFAEAVRQSPAWRYYEIDSGHIPNVTMPKTLAALLDEMVTGG